MKRHKRRKGRTKQVIVLLISVEVLLIVGGLAYFQLRPVVAGAVTVEAGEQTVEVEKFLLDHKKNGSFLTDIKALNTSIPGMYEIKIQVGDRVHTSTLEIVDTIAPTAIVEDRIALRGEVPDPNTFVTSLSDATQVKVSFQEIPDTMVPGDQEVTIILEDSGKNIVQKKAMLTVLDMKSTITIEAGSVLNITEADFINGDLYNASFVTEISLLDISKPTTHQIELIVDGRPVTAYIKVVDTSPPKATVNDLEAWVGEEVEAKSFIQAIDDVSDVTVAYKEEPDFNRLGEQKLILMLKDSSGNTSELPVTMTVVKDTEAPEILGVSDKTVYLGESISYKRGVSVRDNKDKELDFSVDNSNVNLKKEGTYSVTYTAKDTAGNRVVKTINVIVKKFMVTEEMVNELCDEALAKITKENMTNREVAYEIYRWIKRSISYSGDSDKSDWLAEAYRGMTNANGDCFTYFAVAQAMLSRAGIDNMEVTRVGGRTRHYWNLINCGDGWYHFDSCPNKDHMESFMLTDREVEEYTNKRGNNYYNFDKSLYPATPEE